MFYFCCHGGCLLTELSCFTFVVIELSWLSTHRAFMFYFCCHGGCLLTELSCFTFVVTSGCLLTELSCFTFVVIVAVYSQSFHVLLLLS